MGDKIDVEAFVNWMITQPNRNGTLYLEQVVRHYVRCMRSAPSKLSLPKYIVERGVFACTTLDDFKLLYQAFISAPNFKEVDYANSHNSFSAGLKCYKRYLEHLAHESANKTVCMETSATKIDIETAEAIELVLSERFSNGFRLNSFIETGRLRKFVDGLLPAPMRLTDTELENHVKTCGIVFSDKVYVVSEDTIKCIKQYADAYFADGANVIFFEAFFVSHENWLTPASVVSDDMLANVFRQIYPRLLHKQTYFGNTSDNVNDVVVSELLRVWGDDVLLTYSQIAERLQYIPNARIKFVLGQNSDFIINRRETSSGDGEVIHISKIDITAKEQAEIKANVQKGCLEHRYVSLNDIAIAAIAERNFEFTTSAIHTAIYQICLGGIYGNYERRGKIITRKGEVIDTLYIMREYCNSQERMTLDELLAFEQDLTGEQHRWIPMQAGYDTMVRIDEQIFVADKYLDFDIDSIDTAIERFLYDGEYTPLQAVTNFAMFPHCNQTWNLFLLESYTRRFSYVFRFDTRSVNSKNVGAIVRKHSRLTYDDIMADVVAKANVTLTAQNVLNCLLDSGLISRRKHKDIESLIIKANIIRERGD